MVSGGGNESLHEPNPYKRVWARAEKMPLIHNKKGGVDGEQFRETNLCNLQRARLRITGTVGVLPWVC